MSVVTSYFSDFLAEIRPTEEQKKAYKEGHQTLRERLTTDEDTAELVVSTFLQGSYRRATAVRPEGKHRPDVDVIVVTNIDSDDPSNTPDRAVELFIPFLERHYAGQYERQNRSVAITVDGIDLDFVITAKPVESDQRLLMTDAVKSFETPDDIADWRLNEKWIAPGHRFGRFQEALKRAAEEPEWRSNPLKIPDRELQSWELTHPLEQIRWTWQKNGECNGHYVNVVKALKWWRRTQHPNSKYPKGYPFEHIVGDTSPSGIETIADGVALVLEEIAVRYAADIENSRVPFLPDRGVPSHNVLHRLSFDDFLVFYNQCAAAAKVARRAIDEKDVATSVTLWKSLFGDCFPAAPDEPEGGNQKSGGYTPRSTSSEPSRGRFA
jgi:Second Messenger Oligonucleotide or Dinucleotide Synthetase domain